MSKLRCIELKSGASDSGAAWIARVALSRSGATVYFNGRTLLRLSGGGYPGNYIDAETRDIYWVSGVKKNGEDRHWAGGGVVYVDAAVVDEYLALRGLVALDGAKHKVTTELVETDISLHNAAANRTSAERDGDAEA